MSNPGLHVERTELAWSRTWLAAAAGAALVSRVAVEHDLAGLGVLSVVLVLVVVLASGRRRPIVQGALLAMLIVLMGVTTTLAAFLG